MWGSGVMGKEVGGGGYLLPITPYLSTCRQIPSMIEFKVSLGRIFSETTCRSGW